MVKVTSNYEETESHSQGVLNVIPFINKYKWKEINCPSKIDDWKTFQKNNLTIALNILHTNGKKTFPAYISNINPNYAKQIVLLMIPNEKKEGEKRKKKLYCSKNTICITKKATSKHDGEFIG